MSDTAPVALLVTRNLPPLRGGMERLNLHLARALHQVGPLAVCGPDGCGAHLPPDTRVAEVPHRLLPWFLARALAATTRLAWQRRPRLVLAGSGLTAPLAWLAARMRGARFVVYAHGLDLVAPSLVYQCLWLPFIRRADLILCNSANTRRLAVERGVSEEKTAILHPGTTLPAEDEGARHRFRSRHGLGEGPLMLSVGRLTPRKGLVEFVRQALPAIVARHPDARLLVIGDDARDAVHAERTSERARILRAADEVGLAHVLQLLPPCDDADLSEAYQSADAHVFPVRAVPGDVEGFGMVAIEAAAHGLPTVAFDVGGVDDAVVSGRSGDIVPAGDYVRFAAAIDGALARAGEPALRDACRDAARAFGWNAFDERLLHLLFPERVGGGRA